jgi:hypothetical protein
MLLGATANGTSFGWVSSIAISSRAGRYSKNRTKRNYYTNIFDQLPSIVSENGKIIIRIDGESSEGSKQFFLLLVFLSK